MPWWRSVCDESENASTHPICSQSYEKCWYICIKFAYRFVCFDCLKLLSCAWNNLLSPSMASDIVLKAMWTHFVIRSWWSFVNSGLMVELRLQHYWMGFKLFQDQEHVGSCDMQDSIQHHNGMCFLFHEVALLHGHVVESLVRDITAPVLSVFQSSSKKSTSGNHRFTKR